MIGDSSLPDGKTESKVYNNRIETVCLSTCDDYDAKICSVLRYEGVIEYSVEITPKRDFTVDNSGLHFYINDDCSKLMHGLGHRASKAENLDFKWDDDKQQDCIYIGCVNCGMRLKRYLLIQLNLITRKTKQGNSFLSYILRPLNLLITKRLSL